MPVTVDTVNSSDTLNQGRVKWNANDAALASQGNSLETQQAAHVGEGHPILYYSKSEIDALVGDGSVSAGDIIGSGPGKAVDGVTIGLNASNELEVISDGLEYTFWKFLMSQDGGFGPSELTIKNTLSDQAPTLAYHDVGTYYLLFSIGTLVANKTFILFAPNGNYSLSATRDNDYRITIKTADLAGTLTDGLLNLASICVEVYP